MKSFKNIFTCKCHIPKALGIVMLISMVLCCNNEKKETLPETEVETNAVTIHSSKTYEAILAQEKAWAAALVAGDDPAVADLATVDSIMHRDFRLKGYIGDQLPISKPMYLGMTGMSGTFAEVTSVKIVEEMESIAVARVTWTLDWARNGVTLPRYWDMIDTWMMRKDGTWQVLSRISQPVERPYSDN